MPQLFVLGELGRETLVRRDDRRVVGLSQRPERSGKLIVVNMRQVRDNRTGQHDALQGSAPERSIGSTLR